MPEIVFLVEEPSMEAMLKVFIPRILPREVSLKFIKFQGKKDLENNLKRKLRDYLVPDAQFVVLRDQDSGDCISIKQRLKNLCQQAGKQDAMVRIVCRELESWFLGDLRAIELAFGISDLAEKQHQKKFRNPDDHNNAKQILRELTEDRYQPISSSRDIASYLEPARNTSQSFRVFVEGVKICARAA